MKAKTYDIIVHNSEHSECFGFTETKSYCINFAKVHNKINRFAEYYPGSVVVACNESGKVVFSQPIKQPIKL